MCFVVGVGKGVLMYANSGRETDLDLVLSDFSAVCQIEAITMFNLIEKVLK